MKTRLFFLSLLFLSLLNIKAQQCNPTITSPRLGTMSPNRVIFCSSESETLSTTQTYASYQWYRKQWNGQIPNTNPWVAISGATTQTLTINGANDMLYYFKVQVSENNCTGESNPIMTDGYAYGLPYLITTFQPGTYQQVANGYNVCQGASVLLKNGAQAYGTHTWFKCLPANTSPTDPCVISGATGATYTATESGTYSFLACTNYCPDQCLTPGVSVQLNFGVWNFCNMSTDETIPKENNLSIYPNPTTDLLFIGRESDKKYPEISIIDMSGKLIQQKKDHKFNEAIDVSGLVPGTYMIVSKSLEGKVYRNKFIKK